MKQLFMVIFLLITIAISGCSAKKTQVQPMSTANNTDLVGVISSNHGHSVLITTTEQDVGQAITLQLTSGSGHTHTLSLDASQVQTAAAGKKLEAVSSVDSGHSHIVTFNK